MQTTDGRYKFEIDGDILRVYEVVEREGLIEKGVITADNLIYWLRSNGDLEITPQTYIDTAKAALADSKAYAYSKTVGDTPDF